MRFDKQRFCGKLFQKTSGIEIPRYLKNRFFACGNGNGKTAFLARGNGNGNTAAVPISAKYLLTFITKMSKMTKSSFCQRDQQSRIIHFCEQKAKIPKNVFT